MMVGHDNIRGGPKDGGHETPPSDEVIAAGYPCIWGFSTSQAGRFHLYRWDGDKAIWEYSGIWGPAEDGE